MIQLVMISVQKMCLCAEQLLVQIQFRSRNNPIIPGASLENMWYQD